MTDTEIELVKRSLHKADFDAYERGIRSILFMVQDHPEGACATDIEKQVWKGLEEMLNRRLELIAEKRKLLNY